MGVSTATRTRALPVALSAYIALLAAGGIAVAIVSARIAAGPASIAWTRAPAFLALLAAAAYLILRVPYRDDVMALDLFEAVLACAIVVYPGPVVVALAMGAHVIVEAINRNAPIKAAFNVAQWMLAAGTGSIVFTALRSAPGNALLDARTVVALLVALTGVALVNMIAFSFVIKLAQGARIRSVLVDLVPSIALGWAVNCTFGVLLVAAYTWGVASLIPFALALVLLRGAYGGYATAVADRARMRSLGSASSALAQPVDPMDALAAFLLQVRGCFAVECVDLVLRTDSGLSVHRSAETIEGGYEVRALPGAHAGLASMLLSRGVGQRVIAGSVDDAVSTCLAAEGWRDCVSAPLVIDGSVAGVLCAYNRSGPEGFEDGEMAVLEALASEAAGAVRKSALLAEVFDERRKLSEIITHTSDGIMTLDADGRILSWNAAMESITGYHADDMVGSAQLDRLRTRDGAGGDVLFHNWAARAAMPPESMQIRTADADTRWLACSYTQVPDPDGTPSLLIVVARDATRAHEIEQLKDDFIATVSHELRTPLTPIRGWAETLVRAGDKLDPAQRAEAARSIQRHADRLERLITNMLEVSMIERGVSDRSAGHVDVGPLLERVVTEFAESSPGRRVNLSLGAGNVGARGDSSWTEQILSNLVSNAIKYSPPGAPIDIRVAQRSGWVEISVSDHGPGIAEHDRERVFERFQRLGNHLTRETSGSGLGLYIARQLAAAIGGSIALESAPGEGATFTLRLRASRGHLAAVG